MKCLSRRGRSNPLRSNDSHAATKIRRLLHRYRSRFMPSAVILLYHRVIELPSDPYLLSVSPPHFAEHLAVLRKHGRPISFDNSLMVYATANSRGGHSSLPLTTGISIISFTQSHCSNSMTRQQRCSWHRFSTDAREFWWDTLERILLETRCLPQNLRLVIGGVPHEWRLGSAAEYAPDDYVRHHSWNYGRKDDPTHDTQSFVPVHQLLKALDEDERWKVLQDLAAWASVDTSVQP